jgi:hypothetical protein
MMPVSEKAADGSSSDRRTEMQIMLRIAGGQGSAKDRLRRAAKLTGLPWSRAKDMWYRDPRVLVRPEELQKARSAALEALRHEHRRASELLAQMEALHDQDFHSDHALALRSVAFGSHCAVES